MKMPFSIAQRVHWNLQTMVCGPDDLSPLFFKYGGTLPEKEAREDWQNAVEVIYRLLKSGLLKFTEYNDYDEPVIKEPIDLAKNLASQNPFDDKEWFNPKEGIREMPHWYVPLLSATHICKALMQKHGIDNYDADTCQAFIEEMEMIFEAAGVTWTDKPLIPIRPADSDAS